MRNHIKTLILIIVCILSLNFFQKPVRSFFYGISSPIQSFFWNKGQDFFNFSETIIKIDNFKEEMERLKKENRELILENVLLQELAKENELLKKTLDADWEEQGLDFKIARIIAKEKDSFLINQGQKQGISEGLLLITEDKVLVGEIIEVFKNHSKVILTTHPASDYNAEVLEKNILGMARGEGGSIKLDFVDSDEKIEKGDIITSNDFIIGEVIEVIKKDVEPFLSIKIKPAFNSRRISYLFIIND